MCVHTVSGSTDESSLLTGDTESFCLPGGCSNPPHKAYFITCKCFNLPAFGDQSFQGLSTSHASHVTEHISHVCLEYSA